jgi:Xaa-Pro aminopeptidase
MIDHSADGLAFDKSSQRAELGTCITAKHPAVEPGDFLTLDFGAIINGYHADMTRTFVVGREPSSWQVETYDLVFAAQRAGREALAPGTDISDVDRAARSIIEAAGHGEHFPHGLGHGVGLEIHEAPLMGYGATGKLQARIPVTVEPGVYLPAEAACDRGHPRRTRRRRRRSELLTMTTKEPPVLD